MDCNPYPGTFTDHVGEPPDRVQDFPNPPRRVSSGEASTATTDSGLSYHEPGGAQCNLVSPSIYGRDLSTCRSGGNIQLALNRLHLSDAPLDGPSDLSTYLDAHRCASPTAMHLGYGGPVFSMDPTIRPELGGMPQHGNVPNDFYPPPTGVSLQHTKYGTYTSSPFMPATGHAPSTLTDNRPLSSGWRESINSVPIDQTTSSCWGDSAQRPVASMHSASASMPIDHFVSLPLPTPTSQNVSGATKLLFHPASNGHLRSTSSEGRAGGRSMYGSREGANTTDVLPSLPVLGSRPVPHGPRRWTTGHVPVTSVSTQTSTFTPVVPSHPSAPPDWPIHPVTGQRYLILDQTRYVPTTHKAQYIPSNAPTALDHFPARASTKIVLYELWYPLIKAARKDLSDMPDRDALAFPYETLPQKPTFRILFPGFRPYRRQVNVVKRKHNQDLQPTKGSLAVSSGLEMAAFLEECREHGTPFGFALEHMYLVSVERVSTGSLQPRIAVML